MKTVLKYSVLIFGILVLISCDTRGDSMNEKKYYQFNDEDRNLIISYNYQIGQIITYENQYGEQIHLKVILNELKKQEYYGRRTFSGGGGGLSHYYDSKIIRLEILENQIYGQVNYIFSKNMDIFNNGINFPLWNVPSFTFIDEIQNPANIIMRDYNDQNKTQMTINNHLFKKVVVVESGSDEGYPKYPNNTILNNMNMIFYDYDFGLIQFNDITGGEWKLIYPE